MMHDKSRYIVPNLFTSLNFLLGVWSISYSSSAFSKGGDYSADLLVACHLIILSALLDKLDGFAARIMNASSEFGAQFDSLADLIAFGLAPAFALFFGFKELAPDWFIQNKPVMIVALSFYVLATAMRLAKYNALDGDSYKNHFVGLPSTFAGIIVALLLWLMVEYKFFEVINPKFFNIPVIIMIASAFLMVSPFFLPKLQKNKSKLINIILVINIVAAYVFGFARIYPEYLMGLSLVYLVFGFGSGFLKRDEIINEANNSSKSTTVTVD